MQVIISVLDFDEERFLSLEFTLHSWYLAPIGLKASSFSHWMFGTDADNPFAFIFSSLRFGL
jgi:hypothetical protein